MLGLLHSPIARKNSCSVGVGITCVTKPAVSQLLSNIQCLLCVCSIGNELQNMLGFFFQFDALHICTACRLSNSESPSVLFQVKFLKLN